MCKSKLKPAKFSCQWAGCIPFEKSLEIQESLKAFAQKSENCFLGFESSLPVISLGLRADGTHILWNKDQLKKSQLSVVKVRRGGEATLHTFGQLIIYPVIRLNSLGLKVKDFILTLQNITQLFLKEQGIQTKKGKDFAGLYTENGKIAFFGIHISRGISQNGLSINVNNDLRLFDSIKSCGQLYRSHDRMSEYKGISIDRKNLFFSWCDLALKELN